jgi:hypothetical protein
VISGASVSDLLGLAKQYNDRTKLLVVNWRGTLREHRATWAAIFKQIGGGELPSDDHLAQPLPPGSMIGILGAQAGPAFFNHRDTLNPPYSPNMSGYLRRNELFPHMFDFVFSEYVPIDTASSQTDTTTTITITSTPYTITHPASVSGFQLLRMDPKTLGLLTNTGYATNDANGTTQSAAVTRLANDLEAATRDPVRPLVILQAYGNPAGHSADWDRAALAIQALGGTRQVFNDLNQPNIQPGSHPARRKGGYAFIGRTGTTAPRAEVSSPLDNLPGRLTGLLLRSRTADFEPMLVGAPNSKSGAPPVNEQMVQIVNQAPTPFPPLAPSGTPPDQVQAAENFLGGPHVMGVCSQKQLDDNAPCNVRETYVANYASANWPIKLTALLDARDKCQKPPQGVDPKVCELVRSQLFDEVKAVGKVTGYLGPLGLQLPFGAAGVAALANLGKISDEIQQAVKPPPADNTVSNRLSLASYATKVGALFPPPVSTVASGLGGAFTAAAYLTQQDSSPNLIGPAVQTTAAQFGKQLAKRYEDAGDQLNGIGKIVVSDYGKLTAVAGKVDSDPDWRLNPTSAKGALIKAAERTIYETLIPKAFPVLYDLGDVGRFRSGNYAKHWRCEYRVVFVTKVKYLFHDEPEGGQVVMRFPKTNWNPLIAVGAVHAVGHVGNARIPSPPANVADELFQPLSQGGLGMSKLEFYSPPRFRFFPPDPHRRWVPGQRIYRPDPYEMSFDRATPQCRRIPNPPGDSG